MFLLHCQSVKDIIMLYKALVRFQFIGILLLIGVQKTAWPNVATIFMSAIYVIL